MTIDEDVIRRALLRAGPNDFDAVLTAVEAYRTCVRTAQRLVRTRGMQERRDQALECAGYCRTALETYAVTGSAGALRYPASGETRFVFARRW